MSDSKTLSDVMPSATPSEADIAAWKDLPRDEQVRRMRLALTDPERNRDSGKNMADIWAEIKTRRASSHG